MLTITSPAQPKIRFGSQLWRAKGCSRCQRSCFHSGKVHIHKDTQTKHCTNAKHHQWLVVSRWAEAWLSTMTARQICHTSGKLVEPRVVARKNTGADETMIQMPRRTATCQVSKPVTCSQMKLITIEAIIPCTNIGKTYAESETGIGTLSHHPATPAQIQLPHKTARYNALAWVIAIGHGCGVVVDMRFFLELQLATYQYPLPTIWETLIGSVVR